MLKFISTLTNAPIIQKFFLQLHRNPHILYYHMVNDRKPVYYYQEPITADVFVFQVQWLLKNKFEFVPLSEINKGNANKRRVSVTTDDGFIENYTCVAPILNEYKIPATFFLLNNCIDNKDLMWVNKLYAVEHNMGLHNTRQLVYKTLRKKEILFQEKVNRDSIYQDIPMKLKDEIANEVWAESQLPPLTEFLEEEKPYMNQEQIKELISAGFTIGAHTFSHPKCSVLSLEELKHEVVGSIDQLRKSFDTSVDYFAYPFGSRPKPDLEERIFHLSNVNAFLGTKNRDSKLDRSIVWERDKMEQPKTKSLFWFSVIPVVRKFLLKPLGIYK